MLARMEIRKVKSIIPMGISALCDSQTAAGMLDKEDTLYWWSVGPSFSPSNHSRAP